MTQFKAGQKVRIKGTDIEGVLYSDAPNRFGIANVESYDEEGCLRDYYVPAELVEAIIVEPITVTFDPVGLDGLDTQITNIFGGVQLSVRNVPDRECVTMDSSTKLTGNSFTHADARKLAHAILTITEAQNNG